jgi:hypothetical protein
LSSTTLSSSSPPAFRTSCVIPTPRLAVPTRLWVPVSLTHSLDSHRCRPPSVTFSSLLFSLRKPLTALQH